MTNIITTIEIKRTNGSVETVDVSDKFPLGLTDGMFRTVKAATAKAGKGECLSYNVVRPELSADDEQYLSREADRIRWYKKHGFSEGQIN